ncbi:hypothetical protein OCF43_26275 [Bacillus cereus]|nr:hypothetical protein [Bacillus cereus]
MSDTTKYICILNRREWLFFYMRVATVISAMDEQKLREIFKHVKGCEPTEEDIELISKTIHLLGQATIY